MGGRVGEGVRETGVKKDVVRLKKVAKSSGIQHVERWVQSKRDVSRDRAHRN